MKGCAWPLAIQDDRFLRTARMSYGDCFWVSDKRLKFPWFQGQMAGCCRNLTVGTKGCWGFQQLLTPSPRGGKDPLLFFLGPQSVIFHPAALAKEKWGCLGKLRLLAGLLFHHRKNKWGRIAEWKRCFPQFSSQIKERRERGGVQMGPRLGREVPE